MHATEPQGRICPDPTYIPALPTRYVLTDEGRAVLATPVPEQEPAAWVAVRGWCEVCGQALPWVCTWDEPLCSDCVIIVPASNGSSTVVTSPVPVVS